MLRFTKTQQINANDEDLVQPEKPGAGLPAGNIADFPNGSATTVRLPTGVELALYNISGEFYATESLCPHQSAPLATGILCEYVIECDRHGWLFDVRTGECLTVPEKIKTYEVVVEEGIVRIVLA